MCYDHTKKVFSPADSFSCVSLTHQVCLSRGDGIRPLKDSLSTQMNEK